MRAKLTSLLIAILVLADPIHGQLLFDDGLWKACNQTGTNRGFKMRSSHDISEGDKCTLAFQVAISEPEDAEQFCRLYAPWRLVKAEIEKNDRPRVLCHVEATLACKKGWIQMFGYCFRMTIGNRLATYKEAQEQCKNLEEGGAIASLRHKYIIGSWRRYFRGVGQIWVNASEPWHKYTQKTGTVDGDAFAIAFTGKHYDFSVSPNALIKIDPNIKLKVLCEYKPAMTSAEINYLGRRYSEIYYPSVKVPNGILVRSASSYTTSTNNMDVCKRTLKPYYAGGVDPFLPDPETLAAIHATSLPFTLLTRSGARAATNNASLESPACSSSEFRKKFEVEALSKTAPAYVLKDIEKGDACDNMNSAAIVHSKEGANLKIMSDSRSLPIWCKLGRKMEFHYNVSKDYAIFHRENGEVTSHRLFTEKLTYDAASKKCKENGGFLAGVNNLAEANKLGELAAAAGLKNEAVFLGGRRKEQCEELETEFNDANALCARNKVIEWQDNVAQDFQTSWWRDGSDGHKNPSSKKTYIQKCLTYVHGKPSWANDNLSSFLDDMKCDIPHPFFCTNKVEVTAVDPL